MKDKDFIVFPEWKGIMFTSGEPLYIYRKRGKPAFILSNQGFISSEFSKKAFTFTAPYKYLSSEEVKQRSKTK